MHEAISFAIDILADAKKDTNAGNNADKQAEGLIHPFEALSGWFVRAVLEMKFDWVMGCDAEADEEEGKNKKGEKVGQEAESHLIDDPHHDQ